MIKNVLLIGVDQMRFDIAGPKKTAPALTPNLDRLYRESICFERAYASCPLCSPARASMFTGDYAFRHGMGTNCDMYHSLASELPMPERLLHHKLAAAGYRCGFVGKWHVGTTLGPGSFGFEGMDLSGYGNVTLSDGFLSYLRKNGLDYKIEPTLFFNPERQTMAAGRWRGSVASTPSHYLTNYTIELLEEFARSDTPFFATLQYWDPHAPHLVADEFYGLTDRQKLRPWQNFVDDLSGKPRRVMRERDDFYRLHPRSDAEIVEYIGLYCDHMAMLDAEIGRLLEWLDQTGLASSTLVIFTSDHGDMTGAHGGLIDKGLLYEEAIRIPLLFRHPDLPAGSRDALASNMDIMTTVLSLLDIPYEERHGMDLSRILGGEDEAGRDHLLVEYHGLRFLYSQRALIGNDGWKLIFTPGDYDELYNLLDDPHEMSNKATDASASKQLNTMRARLIDETARLGDPLRDCVAKFNGQWRTGSGQFDATSAYMRSSDE
ncbi:sulfatase-like hydrolase/transferase [uncultured Nitratireductor sp.]|uniref:sulfatase-like hydrolase/transferase n=1 Tax=uncultured Nitratireductor sp. TaxID=520953 RepID=UPI0025E56718|nr:sulfatase-like hydrolase/transferase [uncultured Nitratireductor sp.]